MSLCPTKVPMQPLCLELHVIPCLAAHVVLLVDDCICRNSVNFAPVVLQRLDQLRLARGVENDDIAKLKFAASHLPHQRRLRARVVSFSNPQSRVPFAPFQAPPRIVNMELEREWIKRMAARTSRNWLGPLA